MSGTLCSNHGNFIGAFTQEFPITGTLIFYNKTILCLAWNAGYSIAWFDTKEIQLPQHKLKQAGLHNVF